MKLVLLTIDDPRYGDRDYNLVATDHSEAFLIEKVQDYFNDNDKDVSAEDVMEYLVGNGYIMPIDISSYWVELNR
jgi:spore coat polysaccharide biosynthesis protein SpsF (cytidylyltransferase family)